MVGAVILTQWLSYSPWLLPCYTLVGAVVLLPFHARLWTAKDLRLVRDFLPRRAAGFVGILTKFVPTSVREEFAGAVAAKKAG